MRYRIIIQWIDSELERLYAARGILTRVGLPEEPKRPPIAKPRLRRPTLTVGSAVAPQVESTPIAAQQTKAKPRTRTVLMPRVKKPAEVRALSGRIPLGPVVIAPAALKQNRRHTPFTPLTLQLKADPVVDGTLDALVRDLQARQSGAQLA